MTNLSNKRSLQVSPDHLWDSKYQGAKVQSYSRSNRTNALCHVGHCQQPSGTPGNFCKQTSSNMYMAGVHFCGCLCFPNRLGSSYLLELSGRVLTTFHSHSFFNYFEHAAGFSFAFFPLIFFPIEKHGSNPFLGFPSPTFVHRG